MLYQMFLCLATFAALLVNVYVLAEARRPLELPIVDPKHDDELRLALARRAPRVLRTARLLGGFMVLVSFVQMVALYYVGSRLSESDPFVAIVPLLVVLAALLPLAFYVTAHTDAKELWTGWQPRLSPVPLAAKKEGMVFQSPDCPKTLDGVSGQMLGCSSAARNKSKLSS